VPKHRLARHWLSIIAEEQFELKLKIVNKEERIDDL
jgi:hypothetical protein